MISRFLSSRVSPFLRQNNAFLARNNQISFTFSTENEKSDPDFQKQTKVELTYENAQKIIEKWVKENKVVLFMKGTPLNPQCGYSNFVVELLKKYGIFDVNLGLNEYKSVNVLENPIIREQVRIYSKWPTYPQLYIDGQLIGGSDILHEMHKDQSLQKLLEEKGII